MNSDNLPSRPLLPRLEDLHQDHTGKYYSDPLPRTRGTLVSLPPRLSESRAEEAWNEQASDPRSIIVLDLFCGAGGLSLGFQRAGFFVAVGVDDNEQCINTHGHNLLTKSSIMDITRIDDPRSFIEELDLPRVDVLIGGPPCRGFSRVGRGKIRSIDQQKHYDEVINNLYEEYIKFVAILRPKIFLMENVPDLVTYQEGALFDRILNTFRQIGDEEGGSAYELDHRVLNAVNYGIPQFRQRLFIQGNRLGKSITWPDGTTARAEEIVTLEQAIGDLPFRYPPCNDEIQCYSREPFSAFQELMRSNMKGDQAGEVYDHIIRNVREDDRLIFFNLEEGQKYVDVPEYLRRYRSDIFKDKYSKLLRDRPSWTVTAHVQKDTYRYIHYDRNQNRMLSIREFARIQSFPDDFRFCGTPTQRLKQIGNAVPPLLAEKLAKGIRAQIMENGSD